MKVVFQKIEWVFRHVIVYPLFRFILRNKPHDGAIDISGVRSILILRFDKIGDMIVTKPIFRILKRRNPKLRIGVVTSPANVEILRSDASVDNRYVLYSVPWRLFRELLRARKDKYKVVLNFIFNRTTSAALIANFVAPRGIKVGQGAQKYAFYFNKMVSLRRSQDHMVEVLARYIAEVFGLEVTKEELSLFFEIDAESRRSVDRFLKDSMVEAQRSSKNGRVYVVLNLSAREVVKRLNLKQSIALAQHLAVDKSLPTVLISAPEDSKVAQEVERSANSAMCIRYPSRGIASFAEIAALLQFAQCVITPDTSIVHLASAVGTPVLGFFTPLLVNQEWLPYRVFHQTVTAEGALPVSSISIDDLKKGVDAFLAALKVRRTKQA